jgi:isochorismate synthase
VIVLPFDPAQPGFAHQVRPDAGVVVQRTTTRRTHQVTENPPSDVYADNVRAALARIGDGEVAKVVLGRGLEVTSTPPLDADEVVANLLHARPGRYVFSVPTPEGTLLGGSPELLIRRRGRQVTSLPLAGSVPRAGDPDTDQQRAEGLRGSAKDLGEHQYVVDDILQALRPLMRTLEAPSQPELLATDTLWHLATPISAELEDDVSALDLVRRLHPTPAVAGVPTSAALSAIGEIEGDLRGILTGVVGWVDASGDGEFALTIRSGVLAGDRLRLFAGAGIVAGSDPAAEVAETGAKLATMLRAVGIV